MVLAGLFHTQITDWYALRGYAPPARIAQLAAQTTMTPAGRHLFYRSRPQIMAGRAAFVRSCHVANDQTVELGCYLSSDNIYLLDITQPALSSEVVVTAAHETLHAAYARIGLGSRRELDQELEQAYAGINDPALAARMADYARTEPGERDNELHSILGTEYANLPAALEAHYAKYFSNRAAVVAASTQFKQNFDGLHSRIVQQDSQIKATKAQMQTYLAEGAITRYNALVPGINASITSYNQEVTLYNQYAQDLLGTQAPAGAQ